MLRYKVEGSNLNDIEEETLPILYSIADLLLKYAPISYKEYVEYMDRYNIYNKHKNFASSVVNYYIKLSDDESTQQIGKFLLYLFASPEKNKLSDLMTEFLFSDNALCLYFHECIFNIKNNLNQNLLHLLALNTISYLSFYDENCESDILNKFISHLQGLVTMIGDTRPFQEGDNNGDTPAHLFAKQYLPGLTDLLISLSTHLFRTNNEGKSVLYTLIEHNNFGTFLAHKDNKDFALNISTEDIQKILHEHKFNIIHLAVEKGVCIRELAYALIKSGLAYKSELWNEHLPIIWEGLCAAEKDNSKVLTKLAEIYKNCKQDETFNGLLPGQLIAKFAFINFVQKLINTNHIMQSEFENRWKDTTKDMGYIKALKVLADIYKSYCKNQECELGKISLDKLLNIVIDPDQAEKDETKITCKNPDRVLNELVVEEILTLNLREEQSQNIERLQQLDGQLLGVLPSNHSDVIEE